MTFSLAEIVDSYDAQAPLANASTIPSAWYTDERLLELEKRAVFSNWQVAGRLDQLCTGGDYMTTDIADEPIVIVRGHDHQLRGFFNVCRHHAAAVMGEPSGQANQMRCPYHGWTYSLEGELKGTPEFNDVCDFDRTRNGLIPIEIGVWEEWVFARVGGREEPTSSAMSLLNFLGNDLVGQFQKLNLAKLHWFERRSYQLNCNWKVFVDNYLDGGYHVPHLHKGLDSVLDYGNYKIENGERFCLQSSPVRVGTNDQVNASRQGTRALYYWLYPNFMINLYEGVMDTNLVRPLSVDRTEIIFDFYFAEISESARANNLASVALTDRIQQEDLGICESVQRGLKSIAYEVGRLSVRREAGEHLFHRLLYADLKAGLAALK